jgi:DNA-directed RNA polymerase omega subunit
MLMRDDALVNETSVDQLPQTVQEVPLPPLEPPPPITSRFLLVNVAAQRAKQLRKGAFPRLSEEDLATLQSAKAERLAMEEIARGLVHYEVPALYASHYHAVM